MYDEIKNPHLPRENYQFESSTGTFQKSEKIRGEHLKFYYERNFPNNVYAYFLVDVPEDSIDKLATDFARKYVEPRNGQVWNKRLEAISLAIGFAVLVPLIVLLFGYALRWAIAGFERSRPNP